MTNSRKENDAGKRPRRAVAWEQGGLDGLCGIYSTINALQCLRGRAFTEEAAIRVFKHLVGAIARKFPAVLWEGTGVQDMRDIIDRADVYARANLGFGVSRREPLLRKPPARDDLYWNRLAELLAAPRRVLIVGLKDPWEHWSVLTAVTPRTLRFQDSIGIKLARRADFSTRAGATYRIDPHQVFLIECVESRF